MRQATATSATTEDYLQALYNLAGDECRPVAGIRLAERLRLSHPTVIGTIRRMARDGLVDTDQHKKIVLTERGRALAEGVVRRHCLAERLLTDIIGIEWFKAHEEGHHLEHALSPEVEVRLSKALGNPQRCPHGNPIPGSGYRRPAGVVALPQAPLGRDLCVESIDEEAEDTRALLEYLDRHGLVPDARLRVVDNAEYLGTVTVHVEGRGEATIGRDVASKVRVRPA